MMLHPTLKTLNGRWAIWILSAIIMGYSPQKAFAVSYSFATFQAPGEDVEEGTVPGGINNAGQIVGYFLARPGQPKGFLKTGESYATIDVPGALSTVVGGINDAGQIVGGYFDGIASHGFVKIGNTYTTIEVPGALGTSLGGINNVGQILINTTVREGTGARNKSFIKSGDAYTEVNAPGAWSTIPRAINDRGEMVGVTGSPDGFLVNAFLKTDRGYDYIDVPDARVTEAWGINNAGQIVGSYNHVNGFVFLNSRGFSAPFGGDLYNLMVPGAVMTIPRSINEHGDIVGYFRKLDASGRGGPLRGFVASPCLTSGGDCIALVAVDEPEALLFVLTGLMGWVMWQCIVRDGRSDIERRKEVLIME